MATVQTKIGPVDHGRRMTMAEFLDAEEEPGYLYELARGVVEVSEVPNDPHGEIIHKIHTEFVRYDLANPGLIRWIGHGSDVRLRIPEMISDRHPDLAIIFRDTPRDERGRRRPKLVVEVVSPGREAHERDYVAKREEYLELGLSEYWIVDRFARTVVVLVRVEGINGAEWSERTFENDDVIACTLLPGLDLIVDSIWQDIESDTEDEE